MKDMIEVANLKYFTVTKASCFYTDDYDVVKLEVEPEGCIMKFRKILEEHFPDFENTHGKYKPHLTLAYVKKGLGDKICKRVMPVEPIRLDIVKVDYSRQNGENVIYDS
jgi:2'-5' RNA ligase